MDRPVRAVTVPQAPAPAKRTALIIGINRARGGRPLPGSITDATTDESSERSEPTGATGSAQGDQAEAGTTSTTATS